MKIGTNAKTKAVMQKYGIKTKKKFGQNFLVDSNTLNSIVSKANITNNDSVVEIGSGIGALTELLCECAKHVYSFEIDQSLFKYLEENLKHDNLTFIFKDFLKVDLKEVLPDVKLKVVANLPYYITTPILFKILESKLEFDELFVMMQKEVGMRLQASHNTKEYNALSIILQVNYDIGVLVNVSRSVFVPPPNVDSVVMKLVRHNKFTITDYDFFNKFVHSAFQFKRKNLRNNLSSYNLEALDVILTKYGYSLKSRAEQISVVDFVCVCNDYLGGENEK